VKNPIKSQALLMTQCRTYGARILLGIDSPALPGWADVWRPALRASHPWRLPVSFLSQVVAGNLGARDDNSYSRRNAVAQEKSISQEVAVFHGFPSAIEGVDSAEEVCDCGDDDLLLLKGELGKDG
jgi:hypothetical protein